MIKVKQTRFGKRDGNCLSACIASILELPIEQVDFHSGEGWLANTQAALKPHGLWYLGFAVAPNGGKSPVMEFPNVPCIFVIDSDFGPDTFHCVVGRVKFGAEKDGGVEAHFFLEHDPLGKIKELTKVPVELGFLVPYDYELGSFHPRTIL